MTTPNPRPLTRYFVSFVVMAVMASGSVLVTSATAADPEPPRAATYEDPGPDYLSNGAGFVEYPSGTTAGDWRREDTNCNRWGWACTGDHFYFTEEQGATSWWYLNDVQGVYRFEIKLPEGKTAAQNEADGVFKIDIFEIRTGSTRLSKAVETFTIRSKGYPGWWGVKSADRIELDGKVWIRATLESGYGGVSDVMLEHKDVLPEHRALAKDMCVDGDERLWKRFWAIVALLGTFAAATITALATGGAAIPALVVAIGKAAAATGTVLSVQELQDLAKDVHQQVKERADSKKNECEPFHAAVWWDGYSKFSDDIAKLTVTGESYPTFGVTYCPTRRRAGQTNFTAECPE